MESGENGRTKLGSFLVFLVFLVAEYGMGWLILGMDELCNSIRVMGWLPTALLQPPNKFPIEYVSGLEK